MKKQYFKFLWVEILLLFISIYCILELPNKVSSFPIIGVLIILRAILSIIKYRKNTSISLLIGIISLISISFVISVCLNTYNTAFNWQIVLISNESNIINVKNYLLYINVLFIFIGKIVSNKNIKIKKIEYGYDPIVVIGCFFILLYALIFGFDRGTVGTYISNTNALYEYAIVVFLFAWFYSKNNKSAKKILLLYSTLYCSQGLLFGDRSSCFPMALTVLLLLTNESITMKRVILFGLCGIFMANIIDIFRNTGNFFSLETVQLAINRGLFVNTISYSFYGGTQVIRYGNCLSLSERLCHLFNYLSSFFTGGSSKYSLTVLANSAGFINKGGGMSHTYFYFWGGYIGTIVFAIIIGRMIHYIFNKSTPISKILQITITVFAIRWFVYYPTAFFRTAILVPIFCYFVLIIYNRCLKK